MRRSLPTAVIALMLLLNPVSASRTNASSTCGQAPPQGRVAVRIGFLTAGETTRLSRIRETIRERTEISLDLCYIHAGALPPIPVFQVSGNFSPSEAAELIGTIKYVVGGARVYHSSTTADLDWAERRIPQN